MLKTFLSPEEWPESALCFLLLEISNKTSFVAGSHKRGVLPCLESPEIFFSFLPPDPLNAFGSPLDLSSVKYYA